MAGKVSSDGFGDFALFAEFERDRGNDSTFIKGIGKDGNQKEDENGKCSTPNDRVSSSSDSDSEPTETTDISKNDFKCHNCECNSAKTKAFRRLTKLPKNSLDAPVVQIMFTDAKLSRLCRSQIERFTADLLSSSEQNVKMAPLNTLPNSVLLEENKREGSTIIGCEHFYDKYAIDLLGCPLVLYSTELTEGWEIPVYEQVFTQPLPYEDTEEAARPGGRAYNSACFNCGGPHTLNDCKEPKDFRRIARSRQEFRSKQPQTSRYLVEDDPRFSKYKAGSYSQELIEALGLSSEQLPLFIYNMRRIGYPPGYLKEAEVQCSGISMFDKHGREVDIDGDTMEEGEVDEDKTNIKYDISKVINYHGFNVPIDEGTIDEWKRLGAPPMQQQHSKMVMEQYILHKQQLTEQSKNLKRQLSSNKVEEDRKRARMESDMELSDSEESSVPYSNDFKTPNRPPLPRAPPPVTPTPPPLPKGTPPQTPDSIPVFTLSGDDSGPASPYEPESPTTNSDICFKPKIIPLEQTEAETQNNNENSGRMSRSDSQSDFSDLEEKRKLLLAQLEEVQDSGDSQDSTINRPTEAHPDVNTILQASGTCTCNNSCPSNNRCVIHDTEATNNTPKVTSRSMSVKLGTPTNVLGDSPSNVPSFEKFSVGIAEHIPYENLPNATGSFKRMRNILKGLRDKNN